MVIPDFDRWGNELLFPEKAASARLLNAYFVGAVFLFGLICGMWLHYLATL